MSFNPALLNQNSVKKFVDRLEKVYAQRMDKTVKRTQVFEDVANLFGYDSWYNMDQAIKNAGNPDVSSDVIDLLKTSKTNLLDPNLRKQLISIIVKKEEDEFLQSFRDLAYFFEYNCSRDESEKNKIAVIRDLWQADVIKTQTFSSQISDILAGYEFKRFQKDEERRNPPQNTRLFSPTPSYISTANVLLHREKFIVRDFRSDVCDVHFSAPTNITPMDIHQCTEVLKNLDAQFVALQPNVAKLDPDTKIAFIQELNGYLYKENGVFFKHLQTHENSPLQQKCIEMVQQHFLNVDQAKKMKQ